MITNKDRSETLAISWGNASQLLQFSLLHIPMLSSYLSLQAHLEGKVAEVKTKPQV